MEREEVDSFLCLFFSIKNLIILETELLELTGRWILPEVELHLLPVTEDIIFSRFKRQRSPRKANIRASLKIIVSMSAISMSKPSPCNLDLNKLIKCVLKAPPPVTKTFIQPFRFSVFSIFSKSRPCLQASDNLMATCSAYVRSRSGMACSLVCKRRKYDNVKKSRKNF